MTTSSVTGTSPPSRGSCCRLLSRSSSRGLRVARKRCRKSGRYRASWRLGTSWAVTGTRCCTPASPTSRSPPATGSTPCRPTGTVTVCSGMDKQEPFGWTFIYSNLFIQIIPNETHTPRYLYIVMFCIFVKFELFLLYKLGLTYTTSIFVLLNLSAFSMIHSWQ